ncbi:MAG: Rieske 2Fe-2S domain-containing protein [Ginsengibacter sp.]
MERRKFIRSTCNVCLIGAAGFIAAQLSACSPSSFSIYKATVKGKKILVPLNRFEKSPLQIVRPAGLYYDIAVQKQNEGNYEALALLCTHQQNQLTVTGNGYTCSLHGSNFDKDGNVTKGPAERPLQQFMTSVSGDNLIIQI